MEEVYSSLPVRLPKLNPILKTLYQDWLQGQDSLQANKLLHTEYRNQSQTPTPPPHMQWWEERVVFLLKHEWTAGWCLVCLDHLICNSVPVKNKLDHTAPESTPVSEATRGRCLSLKKCWILWLNLDLGETKGSKVNEYPRTSYFLTEAVMLISCDNEL